MAMVVWMRLLMTVEMQIQMSVLYNNVGTVRHFTRKISTTT
jgi:hypothetical protein